MKFTGASAVKLQINLDTISALIQSPSYRIWCVDHVSDDAYGTRGFDRVVADYGAENQQRRGEYYVHSVTIRVPNLLMY